LAEWADSVINEKLDMDDKKKENTKDKKKEKDADSEKKSIGHGPGPLDRIKVDAEKKRTGKLAKFFGVQEDEETNVVKLKPRKQPYMGALAKDFDDEFGHYDDLGRIGKLAAINRGSEDEMDWDDDSWIPDEEDFEHEEMAKELSRHRGRFSANDVNEMDKSSNDYSGQGHSKRDDHTGKPQHTAKIMAAKDAVKAARKALDKAFKGDVDENFISMAPQAVAEKEMDSTTKSLAVPADKMLEAPGAETLSHNQSTEKSNLKAFDLEEEVEEGLDANQKRVGQLGPTEKVKNNNIGKLVGANESVEIPEELARIIEMARFKR
jgi:hypothetical protein